MKITFIYPAVGKKPGERYIKTWTMEPLPIATLKALTPMEIETEFFDDRLELIDYTTPTDAVAINVEAYTAKRAYDIAAKFRARGIPVIMGGVHPTLLPEEVAEYGDAVLVGNAETVWKKLLLDVKTQSLQQYYYGEPTYSVLPDRNIFQGKKYLPLGLVESGRGCPFHCEFCAVSACYNAHYHPRPVNDVIQDVQHTGQKYIFFTDDNIAANPKYAMQLCKEIEALNIVWASQASLTIAKNTELLQQMAKSGCRVLLVGFESIETKNLQQMHKDWIEQIGDRDKLVQNIHDAGISIYATFVFGFDYDSRDSFEKALTFSDRHKFFFAAFNHLLPFPGTHLYERLEQEGRLFTPKWWLEPSYEYGQIAFKPKQMSPEELSERCASARRQFFSMPSILKRGASLIDRRPPLRLFAAYWLQNLNLRKEVDRKLGLPIGEGLDELPK